MQHATGEWRQPPALPEDPRQLCLVLIAHKQHGRTFQVMRYMRRQWQFPDGMHMSGNQQVICWAKIHEMAGEPLKPAPVTAEAVKA